MKTSLEIIEWFKSIDQPQVPTDALGVAKFFPQFFPIVVVSDFLVSTILAKKTRLNNAAKTWAQDGNLIIDIFQWLFDGIIIEHEQKNGIGQLIDSEFQMF